MGFIIWTTASCLLLGFMGMTWLTDAQRGWVLFAAALAGTAAAVSAGREADKLRRWSNWKLRRASEHHETNVELHGATQESLAELRRAVEGKNERESLTDLAERADRLATEIETWFNEWFKNDVDPFPRGQAVTAQQAAIHYANAEGDGFSEGRVSSEYQTRFHKDVMRLRGEFGVKDLFDPEFDTVYPPQRAGFDNRAVLVAVNGLRRLGEKAKTKAAAIAATDTSASHTSDNEPLFQFDDNSKVRMEDTETEGEGPIVRTRDSEFESKGWKHKK